MTDNSPVSSDPEKSGQVNVEVVTVQHLMDAFQARREYIDEQIKMQRIDEEDPELQFYAGMRSAFNWLEQTIDVWKCEIPVTVLPPEER